uniref:DUF4041 domain-containing protein n=1 Tax=Enterocloster clostridioformis TaxID=1531 RepID=UPI0026701783|nr:DUF4041 domain-containing protein [Enterocloster clostridioformis]
MKKKWYLQTWFICLLCAFWMFIVPAIVGIILLILQIIENRKTNKKYGTIDNLEYNIANLNNDIVNLEEKKKSAELSLSNTISDLNVTIQEKKDECDALDAEIASLEKEAVCKQYIFSDYDGLTSEDCKNKLALLKNDEQEAIKSSNILLISKDGKKKEINDNAKQILRCFNSECDNALLNLSVKNIDSVRSKITKSFDSLNKIFAIDGIQMTQKLLEYKLEELNLVYTYEQKKELEREQQRAIKEQMIEEEKVRREIERQKAKLEKDQAQCSNEINKLISYMQKTQNDIEKQLYVDKIKELEDRLRQLEADKVTVLEREANARAGYVYIISNIGSFGENVYKIGMTRRLEPMDRIKELGSASVPFEFDVHAMIFSDDAPSLETALHQTFEKQSVNRVNLRKEFFRVSLDEIEVVVKEKYNNTVIFTRVPVAKEYNETLAILSQEQSA